MIIVMLISLYTSRVVLQALGVNDFGLYNVIGGIVVMLGFINTSAASATSRFLTFSLGKKDQAFFDYRTIFCAAFFIHLFIALIIVLLAETIGLWYFNNKLVVPESRASAGMWVYQISIISIIVSFTQVPYNASIIAHERMNVYAFVGIYEATAKLLISYALIVSPYDKLILYAILNFCATLSISFFYRWYCVKKYNYKCRIKIIKDTRVYRHLLSYSGWDLIGNLSVTLRSQGVNLILNFFFGPAINAARAVAYQVENAIYHFVTNYLQAVRPVIIKQYALGDLKQTNNYLVMVGRVSFILLSCFAIPLIIESDAILNLWLGTPPLYSSSFLRIVLITGLVTSLNQSLLIGVHACGDVKRYNVLMVIRLFCEIPLIILLLYYGGIPELSFWVLFAGSVYTTCVSLWIVRLNIEGFSLYNYFRDVIIRNFSLVLLPSLFSLIIHNSFCGPPFFRLVLVTLVYLLVLFPIVYFWGLNIQQRMYIKGLLCKRF